MSAETRFQVCVVAEALFGAIHPDGAGCVYGIGRQMARQALRHQGQSQCQALKAAAWPPDRLQTRAPLIWKRRPWLSMRMPL